MKPKRFFLALCVILALAAAWLAAMAFESHLVVLTDGTFVPADRIEAGGRSLVLTGGGRTQRVAVEKVRAVLTGPPETIRDARLRLQFALERTRTLWQGLDRNRRWMAAAGAVLVIGLLGAVSFGRRRRPSPAAPVASKPVATGSKPVIRPPRLAGLADVERFFLNLYRRQIGAPPGAPDRIQKVEKGAASSSQVYELSIKINDEWRSRRMTLGPIGEGSGSRSQCFYAIFDTHMVVKVPPTPIGDFSDYVNRIRYESALVERLSPCECIIPSLSVVLRRVHRLSRSDAVSAAPSEAAYVDLLRTAPEFRDFLRIGGAFAFFMDLSRHRFMSQALSDMNDAEALLAGIVRTDADPAMDGHGFETRYGGESGWIWEALQGRCQTFVDAVREAEPALAGTLGSEGHLREFFFRAAAGIDAEAVEKGPASPVLERLSAQCRNILEGSPKAPSAYGRVARAHAEGKSFARNRSRMEALTVNLLDLLAWLGRREVSVRDLKPDNLLVAGDPDAYPLFLSSADAFSLGLIDLETACDLAPLKSGRGTQPQLGGTPAYATPSHFFPNRVLTEVYGDIAAILHHQDWHAVAAIIFETATGRRLFGRTAGQIPRIMAALQKAVDEGRPLADLYREVNAHYWRQAGEECRRVTAAYGQRLDVLRVRVPRSLLAAVGGALDRIRREADARFDACLAQRSDSLSESDRRTLAACTSEQLRRLCEKYGASGSAAHRRIAGWLEALARLRREVDAVAESADQLSQGGKAVSVSWLLDLMHRTTAAVMATGEAAEPDLPPPDSDEVPRIDAGHTATVQL